MVIAALQGGGQELAGLLLASDLLIESLQPPPADGFPFGHGDGVQDAFDVVEGQTRVLQHPDEDKTAKGLVPEAALSAVRYAARLGATVVGVDPAAVMLRTARLLTRRSPRVRFADGAAEDLPLPDSSVDVAWAALSVVGLRGS